MANIDDLMAIAVIRKLVLEAGYALGPGELDSALGPLELWIHLPLAGLDGQSPVQALRDPDGERRLKALVVRT